MGAVLVDSNVLLDIFIRDPRWGVWSRSTVAALANESILVINPIIYAEVSVNFDRIEDVNEALPPDVFTREPLPYEAGFLAGNADAAARAHPPPEFYIGAHAAIRNYRLLTRNAPRFRSYFPTIQLIAPQ